MNAFPKRAALLIATAALAVLACSAAAPAAHAAPYTISDPSGGDCSAIGTWSLSAHTCTLNTNIIRTSTENGIEIASDGITLDGNGHSVTGYNKTGTGVKVFSRNGVYIKNLAVLEFSRGIDLWNSGAVTANTIAGNLVYSNTEGIALSASPGNSVTGNITYLNTNNGLYIYGGSTSTTVSANISAWNQRGLYLSASNSSLVYGNTFFGNSVFGADIFASNSAAVLANNFTDNTSPAYNSGSAGLSVSSNYWSGYDTPAEGCINTTPFDEYCDSPYTPPPPGGGFSDSSCFLLPGGWKRYEFTWYDNVNASNWILMANPQATGSDLWMDLVIEGTGRFIAPIPGYSLGQLPPNKAFTPTYPGVMGGPVTVASRLIFPTPVVSQRTLWPVGGDSLEEVPGVSSNRLSNRFWWPWYDMQSPGYKDWVMISNPNAFDVYAVIEIGSSGLPYWTGVIPAGGRATQTFPGVKDGPVVVKAYVNGTSDPARVMASQRILMNGDTDFNELPGMPEPAGGLLAWDFVWPWYDNASPGATDWIMITNPTTSINPIYYEILLGGLPLANGGPIAAGGYATPYFPGSIGGPLEVRTYFDGTHIWPAPSICSQRTLWGSSFEETPGVDKSSLATSYYWTWYDQLSAGSLNWVMAANPSATDTITVTVTFTDQASGVPQSVSGDILPGGNWSTSFPGMMGGPVNVSAVRQGTVIGVPVIATQRVLWNGNFNEVWGQ